MRAFLTNGAVIETEHSKSSSKHFTHKHSVLFILYACTYSAKFKIIGCFALTLNILLFF